jgi:hypothetical protein
LQKIFISSSTFHFIFNFTPTKYPGDWIFLVLFVFDYTFPIFKIWVLFYISFLFF